MLVQQGDMEKNMEATIDLVGGCYMSYSLYSVSPLISPIILSYMIPHIIHFEEFGL